MKRFYLLLTMMLMTFIASAQVVTFDAAIDKGSISDYKQANQDKVTKQCVTITAGKGLLGNGSEYRFYKELQKEGKVQATPSFIETTSGSIVKVEFYCTAANDNKQGPGNLGFEGQGSFSYEEKVGTWKGKETKLKFRTIKNQVRCTKIVVTLKDADIQPPKPVEFIDKTIADLVNEKQPIANINLKLTNAKVVYVGENKVGKNFFVRQGDNAIMFYSCQKLDLKQNAVLNGQVKMNYKNFYGIPEMVDMDKTNASELNIEESTEAATPIETTLEELIGLKHICDLVIVRDVTITKEEVKGKDKTGNERTFINFYMNKDGKKVQMFKYQGDWTKYANGKKYDVIAVFNRIFKGAAEVEPIQLVESGKTPIVVTAPIIEPKSGTYEKQVEVSIKVAEGTTAYYTTNGEQPTAQSTKYENPFTLTENTTVKAVAIDAEGHLSTIVSETYTIEKPAAKNQAVFDFNANKWGLPVDKNGKENNGFLKEGQKIEENEVTLVAHGKVRMYQNYTDKANQLRIYTNSSIDLVAPKGNAIVKVEFTFGAKNAIEPIEGYNAETGVWTGNAESLSFVANYIDKKNNQIHITKMVVTLAKETGIETADVTPRTQVIYDLQGRRVKEATKGLYIINGKKVMVK